MVAELNLGFWTSLYGRENDHLWGTLRPIFQVKGLHRAVIAGQLRERRFLRNRVARYEPILRADQAARYAELVALVGWLSPSA